MVDTPLGRLDKPHRENLVQNFFPEASHQVIVFSTDTEIDDHYFQNLQDDVARSYHLRYNQSKGCTEVSTGYFWTGDDTRDSEQVGLEQVEQ
jgi:DNA sulfur modification protein DndD